MRAAGLKFSGVARLAIDETRVAADRAVFRVNAYDTLVIVRKDLADALSAAGFSGIGFRDLVDFGGP